MGMSGQKELERKATTRGSQAVPRKHQAVWCCLAQDSFIRTIDEG